MRAIIIYYSFSGKTRQVSEILAESLREEGEAELLELKAFDESDNFFVQAARGFRKTRAKIIPVGFDLSKYDLICMGTPVWAFGPAPSMNAYLDQCIGLEGKEVVLFTTYGSGAGNTKCLDYMQKILSKKGVKNFKRFSIQQFKVKEKDFVLSEIKNARL